MSSKLFAVLGSYIYLLYCISLTAHVSRAGRASFPYMESCNILAQGRALTEYSTSDLVHLPS